MIQHHYKTMLTAAAFLLALGCDPTAPGSDQSGPVVYPPGSAGVSQSGSALPSSGAAMDQGPSSPAAIEQAKAGGGAYGAGEMEEDGEEMEEEHDEEDELDELEEEMDDLEEEYEEAENEDELAEIEEEMDAIEEEMEALQDAAVY